MPLAPILTSEFYLRVGRLCETQGLPTPRFTRSRCGSGNGNGSLFQTLQHSDRLLRLAECEFRTRARARGEILGTPAAVFQEQARRADHAQIVAQRHRNSVRGSRLRRMPSLPAAAVGVRLAPTDREQEQEQDLERALAEELGFYCPTELPKRKQLSEDDQHTNQDAVVKSCVNAQTPASSNKQDQQDQQEPQEPQELQEQQATQTSGPQLRCIARVPLMRDSEAAQTNDTEAIVGWCSDGNLVQILQNRYSGSVASNVDLEDDATALVRCLDGALSGVCGWVALKSKEGDPKLVTIDAGDADRDIHPKGEGDLSTHGCTLIATAAHQSTHVDAQHSGIDDNGNDSNTDPLPQPEVEAEAEFEPKFEPDPCEPLADQCPWSNHWGLPSVSRQGADGSHYTIQGWLPTPPPSPSQQRHKRTVLGSPSKVKRQIDEQERLARARQFWVLIDNGGNSYGSLNSQETQYMHS